MQDLKGLQAHEEVRDLLESQDFPDGLDQPVLQVLQDELDRVGFQGSQGNRDFQVALGALVLVDFEELRVVWEQ